jgi:antitoxin CcdA
MHMNKPSRFTAPKKATNVSLPGDLVEEAKRLGINMSQACETALSNEVRKAMGEEWKRENLEAMESSNEYVRKHGLPLARFRQF